MSRLIVALAALMFTAHCGSSSLPASFPDAPVYRAAAGPFAVEELLEVWRDEARNRDVPVKIYAPAGGEGPFPVILFSHGLGSSRQGYIFLGREWASRGYVSIHPQHRGSDSELLRTRGLRAIYRSAYDEVEYAARPADLRFVLDEITRRTGDGRRGIWSRLDLSRVGVAGHSYGAHTALTLAGMLVNFPESGPRSFRDERFDAALLLSIPSMEWSPSPREFAPISIPTMHMTGTRDTSRIWRTYRHHRRRGFDSITAVPRYFLEIDGVVHNAFADWETIARAKKNGRLDRNEPPEMHARTPEQQRQAELMMAFSTAFWDAWLRGSEEARQWLRDADPGGASWELAF